MKRSKLLIPVLSTAIIGSSVVLPLVSCGDKIKHYNVSISTTGGDADLIS
ncbi:MAG: hypothetical protein MJ195_01650 [Mycoplasmoidaceae bacterium]|nr:hypothetical protein [Mycoplasmoidaceae bacterium]